jgi:hypothetical protein
MNVDMDTDAEMKVNIPKILMSWSVNYLIEYLTLMPNYILMGLPTFAGQPNVRVHHSYPGHLGRDVL